MMIPINKKTHDYSFTLLYAFLRIVELFQFANEIHPFVVCQRHKCPSLDPPLLLSKISQLDDYKTIPLRYRERKHIAVIVELSRRPAKEGAL